MSAPDDSVSSQPSAQRAIRRYWLWAPAGVISVAALLAPLIARTLRRPVPKRFACVKPGVLYRAGQPTPEELRYLLRTYGIRSVISVRADTPEEDPRIAAEIELLTKGGVHYRQVAMNTPPTVQQIHACLARMNNPVLPRPILVHCKAGRTRTGAVVAIWRILDDGWPREDAIAEARRYGLHDRDTVRFIREYRIPVLPPARPPTSPRVTQGG